MRAFKQLLSVLLCLVLFAGCGGKSGPAEQLARDLEDRGFRVSVTRDVSPAEMGPALGDSRIDLLENKVVLAVPEGNPKNIVSFDKLADRLGAGEGFLAIGNSDVPVGQYTRKIFVHYGLDEQSLADAGVLTYGSNVKEVTTQVIEGAVDCGIIYATDAYSAGLESVDEATADMCGQVIYPAAVLRNSAHLDEAKAFLDYLTGEDAGKVFESVGFTPLA